jgi:hypothetical protein
MWVITHQYSPRGAWRLEVFEFITLRLPSIPTLNPRSNYPPFPRSIPADLHAVYCASNILNAFNFQHPIDHRCLAQICKENWNRLLNKSLRCRDRTRKFSRGYSRTAPRAREGIQGLPRRKSEANQLPQPGGECNTGVLWHFRRGGQPGN